MTLDTLTVPPADPTAPKPFYLSLTLWFNVISAVVVIVGVFVDPSLGFDPRVVALATAIITAGNVLPNWLALIIIGLLLSICRGPESWTR